MKQQDFLAAFDVRVPQRVIQMNDFWDALTTLYIPQLMLNTPMRLAYFIAQVAHESHEFRTTTEYASGRAYEGRKNLGNTEPGDGPRFKGRGDIQLTGRYNYTSFTEWLKNRLGADTPDFVKNPELVAERPWATWATIYYWHSNNLNQWADKGYFKTLTMRINGGLNGYDDRLRHFNNFWPLVKDGLIFRDVV